MKSLKIRFFCERSEPRLSKRNWKSLKIRFFTERSEPRMLRRNCKSLKIRFLCERSEPRMSKRNCNWKLVKNTVSKQTWFYGKNWMWGKLNLREKLVKTSKINLILLEKLNLFEGKTCQNAENKQTFDLTRKISFWVSLKKKIASNSRQIPDFFGKNSVNSLFS